VEKRKAHVERDFAVGPPLERMEKRRWKPRIMKTKEFSLVVFLLFPNSFLRWPLSSTFGSLFLLHETEWIWERAEGREKWRARTRLALFSYGWSFSFSFLVFFFKKEKEKERQKEKTSHKENGKDTRPFGWDMKENRCFLFISPNQRASHVFSGPLWFSL